MRRGFDPRQGASGSARHRRAPRHHLPRPIQVRGSGESWTVGRLLTWTADFLKRKGAESPRLDAEVLLAHVLTWERVKLYTDFEKVVGDQPRGEFRDLVRRRAEGMPVAYLVGRKEFYSLAMTVSPAVLIPRPDSEFVVVEFLNLTKTLEAPRAVDVGTGSGCLALACTHQHKSARFVAIDLSPDALAVAETNAKKLGLTERIEFRQGDRPRTGRRRRSVRRHPVEPAVYPHRRDPDP